MKLQLMTKSSSWRGQTVLGDDDLSFKNRAISSR